MYDVCLDILPSNLLVHFFGSHTFLYALEQCSYILPFAFVGVVSG